jgi:hypothetical protein
VGILETLRKLVVHTSPLIGDVLPALPPIPVQAVDARTHALRALRDYVCALEFRRENAEGQPPIPFKVLPENFHIDLPDDVSAVDFAAGTCVVAPTGRYSYDPTNSFAEQTRDVFGPDTVLQFMATYTEKFSLEYRCALVQQRRAWKAGLEAAMAPDEDVWVLRLNTRGYYGQIATFDYTDGMLADSPDEGRRRRTAQIGMTMITQVVRIVRSRRLVPQPSINTDVDEATGLPIGPTQTNAADLP